MAAPKGHKKHGGRAKGVVNRATADARAAIARFVDGNAHRLQGWLDGIAEGVKGDDPEGPEYLIAPNPVRAFELFQSIIEYHVPKLQRTDVNATVDAKVRSSLKIEFVNGQTKELD